jgi:hypothetical protein
MAERVRFELTRPFRVYTRWPELRRLNVAAHLLIRLQKLSHIPGNGTAMACLRPRLPPELRFATDRLVEAVALCTTN